MSKEHACDASTAMGARHKLRERVALIPPFLHRFMASVPAAAGAADVSDAGESATLAPAAGKRRRADSDTSQTHGPDIARSASGGCAVAYTLPETCLRSLRDEISGLSRSLASSAIEAHSLVGSLRAALRHHVASLLSAPALAACATLRLALAQLCDELERERPGAATVPADSDAYVAAVVSTAVHVLGTDTALALRRLLGDAAVELPTGLLELRRSLELSIDMSVGALRAAIQAAESSRMAVHQRELERVDAALALMRSEHAIVRGALGRLADEELDARFAELSARLDGVDVLLAPLPHVAALPAVLVLEVEGTKPLISACSVHVRYAALVRVVADEALVAPVGPVALDVNIESAIEFLSRTGVLADDPPLQAIEFSRLLNPQCSPPAIVARYQRSREIALRLFALVQGGERVSATPPLDETFDLGLFPEFELHGPLRGRPDAIVQRLQGSTNCKEHAALLLEQILAYVAEIRADPLALLSAPSMLDMAALWRSASPDVIAGHVLGRGQGYRLASDDLLRSVLVEGTILSCSAAVGTFAASLDRCGPGLIAHCLVFDDLHWHDVRVKVHLGQPRGSCVDERGSQRR